ncbi:disease resistance protein Pik-2-like [Triticum dicoccoides]|uniref:disease resistance protein Pik-2-like n=1 Tax=Triticum dicoccoides TaxID=85692 RepID=UPI001891D45D|nr:disease resistance protein Pik-2-like [Triticum dicoccoides]
MENMGLQHVRVFPLTVLRDITSNFSEERVIGHGASGVVYKGVLDNGEVIAVKKLNNPYHSSGEKLGNGEAQFHNELMNLIGVQHQNIIRLVGYCYEIQNIVTEYDGKRVLASVEERVLCLEYMPCGSLKDHISDESCGLQWHERYTIIKGICEGLKYLHTGSGNPIYHLDLKPENILLDMNKIPKIGDFGISRLPAGSMQTFVTQKISGTLGYMPPEYLFKKQISPKFDIFSLGVIMIHLIAGQEGNQDCPYMPSEKFIERVHRNWKKRLQATESSHILEQVRTCTEIALRCVEFQREKRPNITEIVDELNKIDVDKCSDKNMEEEEHTTLENKPEIEMEKKERSEHSEEKMNGLVDSRYARAMSSLSEFPKLLLQFLGNDYNIHADGKEDLQYLYMELEFVQAALLDVADMPQAQVHDVFKLWAETLRSVTYEMEDIFDSMVLRFHGFGQGLDLHEIGQRINNVIAKVQEMNDISPSYNLKNFADRIATSTADPRLSALNKDLKEMVGIEVSTDEVIRKLAHAINGVSEQLNIVSIVGMAGMGKTTLARAVYQRVQEQFDCTAFVSVSLHPNIKKVLMEILYQIDKEKYNDANTAQFEGRLPIEELRVLLANKRYFIVIDDIWDVQSWEIIKSVLIDMRNGSNVVTTTRLFEVAEKAGDVYKLKAISHRHSKELFNTRLFGAKGKGPEIPEELLQKCGGVPLAIITMASLLANKPRDDWSKVYNQIGFGYGGNEDVGHMRKTILLSYYNLPSHLKPCLLHLNNFPADYSIRKETLIWMWVAEGFVHGKLGIGLFKLGEGYFNELINRSLIIPVEDSSRCIINGCRLHDLVLDMTNSLSAELNFLTVLNGRKQHNPVQGTVRRLAVLKTSTEQDDPLINKHTTKVRSFNTTKCHFDMMLPISRFIFLRVLSIEECTFMEGRTCGLKHLEKLHQLRYLGLYNTPLHQLPEKLGSLCFLQTLDLRGTSLRELPFSINLLRQLKCLRADEITRVPDWIGNLTSLEELRLDNVGTSVNFVIELGKLKELRELDIWIQELDEISNEALVKSLGGLVNMEVLRVMSSWQGEEASWDNYVPPIQLREFYLTIAFPGLPKWINASSVPNLSHLSMDVKAMNEQDMDIIGYLPELIGLELLLPPDVFLSIKGDGLFPKLRCFDTSAPFRFLPGAMPALELLHFKVDVRALKRVGFALDDFATLKNLLRLRSVEVEIDSRGARPVHATGVEEAVKRTVDNHPNNPTASIRRT